MLSAQRYVGVSMIRYHYAKVPDRADASGGGGAGKSSANTVTAAKTTAAGSRQLTV
jgi:hypothetical protein